MQGVGYFIRSFFAITTILALLGCGSKEAQKPPDPNIWLAATGPMIFAVPLIVVAFAVFSKAAKRAGKHSFGWGLIGASVFSLAFYLASLGGVLAAPVFGGGFAFLFLPLFSGLVVAAIVTASFRKRFPKDGGIRTIEGFAANLWCKKNLRRQGPRSYVAKNDEYHGGIDIGLQGNESEVVGFTINWGKASPVTDWYTDSKRSFLRDLFANTRPSLDFARIDKYIGTQQQKVYPLTDAPAEMKRKSVQGYIVQAGVKAQDSWSGGSVWIIIREEGRVEDNW